MTEFRREVPMTDFKDVLDDDTLAALRTEIDDGRFPEITVELALQFILSGGILPASDLPVQSFLDLEDWLSARGRR